MITKHTDETLSESNIVGLKSILKYGGMWKSSIINIAGVICLLVSVIITFSYDFNKYAYIAKVTELLLQLIPSLLGFTIAGYTFMMAFIPSRLMDRISEPREKKHTSLYQTITSSLAFNILQHATILIIGYLIHLAIFFQQNNKLSFPKNWSTQTVNTVGFVFVNVLLGMALAVIIQIIVSSFNLAQLYHYDVNKQKLEEKKKAQSSNQNPTTGDDEKNK